MRRHRLTNHRVTEVGAASLKYQYGLGGIFRESGCEDEPSGAAADNDVVKRLARDLVESSKEITHGGCCGVDRGAMGGGLRELPSSAEPPRINTLCG